MSTKSTTEESTPEQLSADQIRSQMERTRLEFDSGVEQLVQGTHALGDWEQYVKAKPLLAFAVCAIAGYMLIPKKKQYYSPDPDQIANLVRRDKLVVAPPQKVQRGGVVSGLTGPLLRIVLQTAAGSIMQKLGEKATPTNDGEE